MKKLVAVFAVMFMMVLSNETYAQIVIKVRPSAPVYVRPAAPKPHYVWVDGNWEQRGNQYVWVEGYWAEPRPNMVWVAGHWKARRGGWVWMPGHWRRLR